MTLILAKLSMIVKRILVCIWRLSLFWKEFSWSQFKVFRSFPEHFKNFLQSHLSSYNSGSPWRDKISLAILHLQEKGVIRMLYDRWWKRPGISCVRDDKGKEGKANALGVDNIGGVFVVLLGGLAIAIVIAIIEFCVNSRKNAQNQRVSERSKCFLF